MEQGLFELYREKLTLESNPGVILARFYCSLYDFNITQDQIKVFNKLLKEFGKENVFYSISDMFTMQNVTHSNIYPLLKYMCKQRVLKTQDIQVPLTSTIEERVKKLEKARNKKLKVGDL
jgi:hypothetical protein